MSHQHGYKCSWIRWPMRHMMKNRIQTLKSYSGVGNNSGR